MDILKVEGATGDYHSNYINKAEAAVKAFNDDDKDYEFGFLHIKAVDDAGHDKSYKKKQEYLKKSEEMVKHLIELLKKTELNLIIGLTGDHTTPVNVGDHTFEPVPVSMTTS